MPIFRLSRKIEFPPPQLADSEGLLAVGGDLSIDRLLLAYSMGIFPWFSEEDPPLWWSPDPRLVLYPDELIVSKSMKKILKKRIYTVTMDTDFKSVIMACAGLRIENRQSTWITGEMVNAYCNLHEEGYAHSIEAWADGELAGGLYGVSLGKCFFGESMFARKSNASKAAFIFLAEYLQRKEFNMIDCQVTTNHLMSLGAREISRTEFLHQLNHSLGYKTEKGTWTI